MGRRKKVDIEASAKEEFPFPAFPWKLVYKDGNELKKCYFDCELNRQKHIDRYNLKKSQIQLSYMHDSQ